MYKCRNKPLSCIRARQIFVKRPKKSIQLSIMLEDLRFCSRFLRQILGVVDVTLIGLLT